MRDGWTDGRTDRQLDRWTDKGQMDRYMFRQRDGWMDRQKNDILRWVPHLQTTTTKVPNVLD